MGEYKDINDAIYEKLMERLQELGYEDIPTSVHNEIVDQIDARHEMPEEFEELVSASIELIENHT